MDGIKNNIREMFYLLPAKANSILQAFKTSKQPL